MSPIIDEDDSNVVFHEDGTWSHAVHKGKARAEKDQPPTPRPLSPWQPHRSTAYNEEHSINNDGFDVAEMAAAMVASLTTFTDGDANGAGPSRPRRPMPPMELLTSEMIAPELLAPQPLSSPFHASHLPGLTHPPKKTSRLMPRLKRPSPAFLLPALGLGRSPYILATSTNDETAAMEAMAVYGEITANGETTAKRETMANGGTTANGGIANGGVANGGVANGGLVAESAPSALGATATRSAETESVAATAGAAPPMLPEVIQLPLQMALVFRELDELKTESRCAVHAIERSRHLADVERLSAGLRRAAGLEAQIALVHHHRFLLRTLLRERERLHHLERERAGRVCGAKCKCGRRCKGAAHANAEGGPVRGLPGSNEEAQLAGAELVERVGDTLKELVDHLARSTADLSDAAACLGMDDAQDRAGFYHAVAHAHYKNWRLITVLLQNASRHGDSFEESKMANKFLLGGVQKAMMVQYPEIEEFDWSPR